VEQPLKTDARAKAMRDNGVTVLGYGIKVAEGVHTFLLVCKQL
jgi:hypothetical protein